MSRYIKRVIVKLRLIQLDILHINLFISTEWLLTKMIAKETVLMVGIGQGLYVFVINHI